MECMSKPWLIGPHSAPGPLEAGLRTSGYSFPSRRDRVAPFSRGPVSPCRPRVFRCPRCCTLEGWGTSGGRRVAIIRAGAEKDGPGRSPGVPLPCVSQRLSGSSRAPVPIEATRALILVPWLRNAQRRRSPECPSPVSRNARRARVCLSQVFGNAPQLIPIAQPVESFWFRLPTAHNATKRMVFTLKVAAPRTRNEGHEVLEHLRR